MDFAALHLEFDRLEPLHSKRARQASERDMWRITEIFLRSPLRGCLLYLLISLPFVLAIPTLEIHTDGATLYPVDDPTVAVSRADRQYFHEDQRVVLLLSAKASLGVASPQGFRLLRDLHLELDNFPGVRRFGVRSLASLLQPPADRAASLRQPYLSEIPQDPADFAAFLGRIKRHPLAEGLFLAADGKSAPLYVPLADSAGRRQLIESLEFWANEHQQPDFELRLTGPVVAETLLGRSVLRDLFRLTPLVVALIALLLGLCLRSFGLVVLVLVEILMVLVWTLGAMALAGVPVTLVTTILPVVLVAMAVIDEIHLLERFQALSRVSGEAGARAGKGVCRAFLGAAKEVGRPLVLTSLTTAAGLLSFLAAPMQPLRHFGLFAAFGVLAAMLMSFTLIPALGALLPAPWLIRRGRSANRRGEAFLAWSLEHRGQALALALVLSLLLAPGLWRLRVQDAWVENFAPHSPVVSAERELNQQFWGTYRFDVVCRAEDPASQYFILPAGLELIQDLRRLSLAAPHVGGVVTYLRPFELVAAAWGYTGDLSQIASAEVRSMRSVLNVIKPRIDLDHYLDASAGAVRMQVLVRGADFQRARDVEAYFSQHLLPRLEGEPVSCHFSGDLPVALVVVGGIVAAQLGTILWTFLGVALLLLLLSGGSLRSLCLLLPAALAVAWVFALMGYGGLSLGVATSMFAALAIGVGVDFALHYAHAHAQGRQRLAGALRALRWNALVLAGGFGVLALSALGPNRSLGLILSVSVLATYGATCLLLPALLPEEATEIGLTCRSK